ncbi:MAG: phage holin family protein [bacterium]|nr:phage holin family protein [bacterium]
MLNVLIGWIVSGMAVFVVSRLLPGVHTDSFTTALVVAVVLGVVNVTIKPILFLLTLPVTIMTLGLFALVINAAAVLLVDTIVPGFKVDNLLWALAFSVVLSLINSFLNRLSK